MPARKRPAPRAHYAAKEITATMQEYAAWLTEQTGYEVDPRSVYLGSALRTAFQAERRADAVPEVTPKPRRRRGGTLATADGVVIAEQRHVEVDQ